MKSLLAILTFGLFSISLCHSQDNIHKKTGEILDAKVLEIGLSEIKYKLSSKETGPIYVIAITQLLKIVYEHGAVENFEQILSGEATAIVKRAHNMYAEVAGQGLLFTVNYDTRFGARRDGWGGRLGFGALGSSTESYLAVPISVNYLLGSGRNFFEIGLGATYNKFSEGDEIFDTAKNILGTMAFMYRLQPITRGFSIRIGFTPVFNSDLFFPYAG